ncbi:NPCBM/NEW2 domain-containing protein, partial [Saccharothrix sp. MB29]|nr:NPCBM/NEW2 domain-containing protein [Saccharothrix sp. MB29]
AVAGTWTVRPAAGAVGAHDVPVSAEFRTPGHPRVHVERAVRVFVAPTGAPHVSDLPFTQSNGWGPVSRYRSTGAASGGYGGPLTSAGGVPAKGLGVHAPSEVAVHLGGACRSFGAMLGLDDETTSPGSVVFQVVGDGRVLHDSGVVRGGEPGRAASVDTTGVRTLVLRVTDAGDGRNFDHADWADARLDCGDGRPRVAVSAGGHLAPTAPRHRLRRGSPPGRPRRGRHPGQPPIRPTPAAASRPVPDLPRRRPPPAGLHLEQRARAHVPQHGARPRPVRHHRRGHPVPVRRHVPGPHPLGHPPAEVGEPEPLGGPHHEPLLTGRVDPQPAQRPPVEHPAPQHRGNGHARPAHRADSSQPSHRSPAHTDNPRNQLAGSR